MSDLDIITERIKSTFGLKVRPQQLPLVAAAMEQLSVSLQLPPDRLLSRLLSNRRLLQDIASELSVGETYFFRQEAHFGYLLGMVRRHQATSPMGRPFRVLSAGCANGAEPYTLSIAIHEANLNPRGVEILGCDICPKAVQQARRGVYGKWAFRTLPAELRERYFRGRKDGRWELLPEIRAQVTIEHQSIQDFLRLCEPSSFDAVLCRNVMVYFSPEGLDSLYADFRRVLRATGRLLIASTDPRPPKSSFPRAERADASIFGSPEPGAPPTPSSQWPQPAPSFERSKAIRLSEARALADRGAHDQALGKIGHLLRGRPDDAHLHLAEGQVHLAEGRWSEAVDSIERSMRAAPNDNLARFWYVIALRDAGRYRKALAEAIALHRALRSVPPSGLLSDAHTTARELSEAARQLKEELQ